MHTEIPFRSPWTLVIGVSFFAALAFVGCGRYPDAPAEPPATLAKIDPDACAQYGELEFKTFGLRAGACFPKALAGGQKASFTISIWNPSRSGADRLNRDSFGGKVTGFFNDCCGSASVPVRLAATGLGAFQGSSSVKLVGLKRYTLHLTLESAGVKQTVSVGEFPAN